MGALQQALLMSGAVGGGGGSPSSLLFYSEPRSKHLAAQVNYGLSQTAASQLSGATLATSFGSLLSLVLFNEGAGVPFDLGVQRPCTKGGSPTWVSNTAGWAGNSPSAADYYILPTNGVFETCPSNLKGGNQATVAIIRRKNDTTLRSSALFGVLDASTGPRCGAHVPFSDGTVYWDFGGASGSNRLTWTGYSVSTEIERWVFVAGSKGMAIYFNGLLKNSSSTGVSRSADGTFAIGSGNGSTGGNADLQQYLFFAMFDAQWNADQVAQWTANPYGFLRNPSYLRIP